MKKKVYAVVNNSLHSDSSYFSIVGIFSSALKAKNCIACEEHDFMLAVDRGDFKDEFEKIIDPYSITSPVNPNAWDTCIVSSKGWYECWRFEEYEIE